MRSLANQLDKLTAVHRPLIGLTNEQLFNYPEANPTDEGGRDFRLELLARRGVYADIKAKIKEADERLKRAEANLANFTRDVQFPDERAYLEGLVTKAKEYQEETGKRTAAVKAQGKFLTPDEIFGYYRQKNLHRLEPLISSYREGKLFRAQAYGFGSFLLADPKEIREDEKAFTEYEAIAILCNDQEEPLFKEITAFYHVRILPPQGRRELFTQGEGENRSLCNLPSLQDKKRKEYWAWNRNYNYATRKFKWKDDGGTAYDDKPEFSDGIPF